MPTVSGSGCSVGGRALGAHNEAEGSSWGCAADHELCFASVSGQKVNFQCAKGSQGPVACHLVLGI